MSENLNYMNFSAIPLFFGVAVFDFEGNGVVINLHASMKNPEDFNKVLVTTLTVYVTFLCLFSSIAYWVSHSDSFCSNPLFHLSVIRQSIRRHGHSQFASRPADVDNLSFLLLRPAGELPDAVDAGVRNNRKLWVLQQNSNLDQLQTHQENVL